MVAALFYRLYTQHVPTISGRRREFGGWVPFRLLALSQKGEAMFRGLLDHGLLYHKYDVAIRDGMGLGSNLWLDARSLDFMVENSPEDMGRPLYDQEWERVLVILNQGPLQSCTGNTGIGALGTQPLYDAVGRGPSSLARGWLHPYLVAGPPDKRGGTIGLANARADTA